MKTVLSSIFSMLLLLTSFSLASAATLPASSSDSQPLLLKVKPATPHQMTVRLANLQENPTALILKDQDGQTYFQKNINDHNGYLLQVDMKNAPTGRYFLHATQGEEEIVVVLYRHQNQILVSEGSRI